MNNPPTTLLQKEMKEFEKKYLVGKNVHSVYMHCRNCWTWGIGMLLDTVCGNCNKDTDIETYYDTETIFKVFSSLATKLVESFEGIIGEDEIVPFKLEKDVEYNEIEIQRLINGSHERYGGNQLRADLRSRLAEVLKVTKKI